MAKTYDNVVDELDALIRGSKEYATDESADDSDANNEDTDHTEQDDTGSDTNSEAAEPSNDTDEGTENEGEENTQVDNDGVDVGGDNANGKSPTTENGENTDTAGDGSGVKKTETVDYQKQYAELLEKSKTATEFYEKVAGVKFKANGKEVEGFKDPQRIIQAQQMAYNYSEKMAGFKQYRPYMGPLKDRGMLDDPAKFDLAMSLIDGDKEALKQHMANIGVDPMELDMESIRYAAAPKTSSRDMIAIEDALDVARSHGVEDKIFTTVLKEWDDDSFKEFIGNRAVQNDLITQMADGTYDIVMSKVTSLSVIDDRFAGMKMVDKYRAAINELNRETAKVAPVVVDGTQAIAAAKATEIAAKAVEEYKAKVTKDRNEKAKAEREKATAVSKPKSTTPTTGKHDPMALSGKEIADMLDRMMMGKK